MLLWLRDADALHSSALSVQLRTLDQPWNHEGGVEDGGHTRRMRLFTAFLDFRLITRTNCNFSCFFCRL